MKIHYEKFADGFFSVCSDNRNKNRNYSWMLSEVNCIHCLNRLKQNTMKLKPLSPSETGKAILKGGFTIEDYENIQSSRRERLVVWKEKGIPPLITNEEKLIAFGEK